MKKKKVENTIPTPCRKNGWWIKCQLIDEILILNVYNNKILQARHCINTLTHEYATLVGNTWYTQKVERAIGLKSEGYYCYRFSSSFEKKVKERFRMSKEDEQRIKELIEIKYCSERTTAFERIERAELEYGRIQRDIAENNRIDRVIAMMERVPAIPEGIKEWINQRELGGMDYCIKNRERNLWSCSSCGKQFAEKHIKRTDGGKARNNDMIHCPKCKKEIKLLRRKQKVEVRTHFCMVQPIDDEVAVTRHFVAVIECLPGCKKKIGIAEEIRIILFKNPGKKKCSIYYEQYTSPDWIQEGKVNYGCFDNKSNRANKKEHTGYMYDGGIEEAFRDTAYEPWTRLFTQFAAAGKKLNYNGMMIAHDDANYMGVMELLFRGRFERLLQEESEKISIWSGGYFGILRLSGSSIEDVFDIGDRQKINRIRDKNGGLEMIKWMRWSEKHHEKISDKALIWLHENKLEPNDMSWTKLRFTIEKAMNYIERQRKESYPSMSVKGVINQYEDYMNMCEKLHKDTRDEMIYRPRELKRRHAEAVMQIEQQEAQIQADEYSKKYSEAEKVLEQIKDKFEFANEEYFIKVPRKIVDIVIEGRVLHHCAGSTDRYFDRIKQHETYICFLRKVSEPEIPFYTIEVEPGGTIRQHRGEFDEEPEIEKVKPFLRTWQKEIRKRMSKEDHELAAASKVKREENIKELREKNNTRVLNGLMEDFMEAV